MSITEPALPALLTHADWQIRVCYCLETSNRAYCPRCSVGHTTLRALSLPCWWYIAPDQCICCCPRIPCIHRRRSQCSGRWCCSLASPIAWSSCSGVFPSSRTPFRSAHRNVRFVAFYACKLAGASWWYCWPPWAHFTLLIISFLEHVSVLQPYFLCDLAVMLTWMPNTWLLSRHSHI